MNQQQAPWMRAYQQWLERATDEETQRQLLQMGEKEIEDAFYRDLAFGTGGLRGTLGAGTNRMNTYVVAKATQGLADYLGQGAEVAIGYDSRLQSDVFAHTAAGVFAANGITVHLWPELLPVPTVSFAVRELHCAAGVMITASHNPAQYNGYKVYGPDGCQITTLAAEVITEKIHAVDLFDGVHSMPCREAEKQGRVRMIPPQVLTRYLEQVKAQSVLYGDAVDRSVAIVYTPLNGTGLKPVTRVLEESGFTQVSVVEQQRSPDGHFPTCPYPNPEIREAMELGLKECRARGADLLLATDPDCDRCGIAVKDGLDYQLLTGNQVGLLLLDFICSQRTAHHCMPAHPVFVKTIVTMDLAEKIAAHYGVQTRNVLTGFKYIGEVIGGLEQQGRAQDYICGFEESYGYLTGTYVRDKDAVNAALMICEMFAFYKTRGISLLDKLRQLYREYGYCLNTLHSYTFEGSAGMQTMGRIMHALREGVNTLGGQSIVRVRDYAPGIDGLPPSDVLQMYTSTGSVVVRPSGTEPKLKVYLSVTAPCRKDAEAAEQALCADLEARYLRA